MFFIAYFFLLFETISVETVKAQEQNLTSESDKILRLLATGYLSRSKLIVDNNSSLRVRGRNYWYGDEIEKDPSQIVCIYEIPHEKYFIWKVFYPNDSLVTRLTFQCHGTNEDCCNLECCSNVYKDRYIVLAVAGFITILATIFGIFMKFKDEIAIVILHFRVRKMRLQRIKSLMKKEDANYINVDD